MANNVTLHQLNNGVYDNLYPRAVASKSYLTVDTSTLYNLQNGTAEQAVQSVMHVIALSGNVRLKIVDENGNPVSGAIIKGLIGDPISDSNGQVQGIYQYNPVTVVSPYVDIQDKSVDISNYIGSVSELTITLSHKADGTIVRYTNSTNVRFSSIVKTIDVCCVGAGGGGGEVIVHSSGSETYHDTGAGGGGGAIENSYGLSVVPNTEYQIKIGSGGATGYHNIPGGSTSFMDITAVGGKSPSYESGSYNAKGGPAGKDGCGNGGDYGHNGQNSTISEFDDGATFYSGGGGAGSRNGGTPNGANGGYTTGAYPGAITTHPASTPGIGGGGGGGEFGNDGKGGFPIASPSQGGSGLVAIRVHF